MTGKGCVAIASDTRFGVRAQTVACDFPKAFQITPRCFVGLPGLGTDTLTVLQKLQFRAKMYKLREQREMKPSVFANMVSSMLYEKRFGPFFVEPVVAGLEPDGKPFICAMDLIGAPVFAKDVALAGTATEAMYGMCESMWRPDLEPEELFEIISQCMLASVNRDALSGWGAVVTIITPTEIITRQLKGRCD
eukprot:TRINITY_DN378_c0_g1_i2.p1 TRINITY_DN378_c0_g1~~TRINITY_DN378_c0_g1_i2.p1  ORF type:complete len:192 (+),score=58.06 TRINITY_DN378_c0_g1_i2:680-1255(+)